ncbi:putative peptidyl-tRNA hydrolase 2 [Aphis craccivora]|uniref:Putative peptidyl-tRNA hydrolase 2 n=1 Tax=Aphis craccivora TaxID=307492 RepID=A0A6G0YIE1_APHCR|nr:putative peptidyl-tRNA hydrolase 2 [Aphis craccivora]
MQENAGDVNKAIIVEQLLTTTSEPIENIKVVEVDGDQLWEDVIASNKMVIVINIGLKTSVGEIASQVIEYHL